MRQQKEYLSRKLKTEVPLLCAHADFFAVSIEVSHLPLWTSVFSSDKWDESRCPIYLPGWLGSLVKTRMKCTGD